MTVKQIRFVCNEFFIEVVLANRGAICPRNLMTSRAKFRSALFYLCVDSGRGK